MIREHLADEPDIDDRLDFELVNGLVRPLQAAGAT
jgi:hypothetical protein